MTQALDIELPKDLLRYLRERRYLGADERADVRVLSGGVSNRTVLVSRKSGEAWVIKQALEKLRVKADWFSSPERIHREALGMRVLQELAPKGAITPLVFEDHEHHLLAMQAVPEPHENWKTMLLRGEVQSDHVAQFGKLLGSMHREARKRSGELQSQFADVSFFESLRLEPYYAYSAQQVPDAASFMNRLITDTRANRSTLVHGDYSPKNVLVREGQLVLLDHEVIHWGDPAFDLGFSLTHLLSKAHHLPAHRATFARAALDYWGSYENEAAQVDNLRHALEERAVRNTLGCLLARVAGRSPLEYLDATERARQQKAVLSLMAEPPVEISQLIERFLACL